MKTCSKALLSDINNVSANLTYFTNEHLGEFFRADSGTGDKEN